jgi:hypothetical protein
MIRMLFSIVNGATDCSVAVTVTVSIKNGAPS